MSGSVLSLWLLKWTTDMQVATNFMPHYLFSVSFSTFRLSVERNFLISQPLLIASYWCSKLIVLLVLYLRHTTPFISKAIYVMPQLFYILSKLLAFLRLKEIHAWPSTSERHAWRQHIDSKSIGLSIFRIGCFWARRVFFLLKISLLSIPLLW